jgi:membrane-associated phospholipid phosphatase
MYNRCSPHPVALTVDVDGYEGSLMLTGSAVVLAFDGSQVDGSWYTAVTDFARATPWLNGTVSVFSGYGVAMFGVLIIIGWWIARRAGAVTMTAALAVPVAAGLAYAATSAVKVLVEEPRPCYAYPTDFLLESCPTIRDFSFPSSHSAVVAAIATGLIFVNSRLAVLGVLAAAAMGLSRIYVGAHYPHDVLAGLVLGALVGAATVALAWRYATPLIARLRHSRLHPLLVTEPAPAPTPTPDKQPGRGPS